MERSWMYMRESLGNASKQPRNSFGIGSARSTMAHSAVSDTGCAQLLHPLPFVRAGKGVRGLKSMEEGVMRRCRTVPNDTRQVRRTARTRNRLKRGEKEGRASSGTPAAGSMEAPLNAGAKRHRHQCIALVPHRIRRNWMK